MAKHKPTYDYTLIYAFSIDDGKHDHMLKVGKATINYFKDWRALEPDGELLRNAAKARIDQETGTAAIEYKLEYAEIAIYDMDGEEVGFDDHEVHEVLENSGYGAVEFPNLQYPPPPSMAAIHPHVQPLPQDPYRLPPPGAYRPDVYGQQPPPPPQVVYQAAAPRQRTAIACRYCRRRKVRWN